MISEAASSCDALMRRWMTNVFTGCAFAPLLSCKGSTRIRFNTAPSVLDEELGRYLSASLDGSAAVPEGLVLTFPNLRHARDVAKLLNVLCRDERWKCTELKPDPLDAADVFRAGLTWQTALKHRASVMGLAPLGTMPITRRSPYVALVVWPGAPSKPKPEGKLMTLSEMPHGLRPNAYDAKKAESEASTKALLAHTQDAPVGYKLTFRLGVELRDIVFA